MDLVELELAVRAHGWVGCALHSDRDISGIWLGVWMSRLRESRIGDL